MSSMLKNLSRVTKELKFLAETPGPGISVTPNDGMLVSLDVTRRRQYSTFYQLIILQLPMQATY